MFKSIITLLMLAFLSFGNLGAQSGDSLKTKIQAFIAAVDSSHEKKYLNIDKRDLGGIDETEYEWVERFMLKSFREFEDNLGYERERKIYFSVYNYYEPIDRKYALKYWLENFIEDETLRPGRKIRELRYATPTIILINESSIAVANFDCRYYKEDNFEFWKDLMLKHLGNDETMVIEILCDGPVEWTENAPDPRTRGLF